MKFSNKTYDILKFVVMVIGYLGTFVLSLTDIWGFPYGAQICATIAALGMFLGSILEHSSMKYKQDMEDHADDHFEDGVG